MNKDILNKLVEKYKSKQLVVAIEELSELAKELCKVLRGLYDEDNVIEEIADVYIMLEQMKIYFGVDDNKLNEMIDYKINRTKERML